MPTNKVSKFTIQINDESTEDFELVDNNNAIVEIKDTVTENTSTGTEQHTFKETTADGTENKVSDFLIASKQITDISANSTNTGIVITFIDQSGNTTTKEITLS